MDLYTFIHDNHLFYNQEKRAQDFIKIAEAEVEKLRSEFERWDNVPPADEVTYELGILK